MKPLANRRAWQAALLVSALALAHCGGGGGLPDEEPPPVGAVAAQRAFSGLGFDAPLFVTAAPGDTRRLFVVEQGGRVYVIDRSSASPGKQLFLDIGTRLDTAGEQGLLGLAFDPAYATNHRFYVYYSAAPGTGGVARSTVVARYTARSADEADPASETKLLTITQPADSSKNHNGGWIGFGPDGKLYVAVGDGGGTGDPDRHAQDLGSLLGKLLRIDGNGDVPADNPFVGQSAARAEIWAYGLRNPFRNSFDRDNGTLWIGDVGQSAWEEIDIGARGANYGWRKYEGTHVYNSGDPAPAGVTMPVFEYDHSNGRCSIIGGYAYRGAALAGMQGRYVYADYCSGEIWALADDRQSSTRLATLPTQPTSFGEDSDGELYLSGANGALYKLVPP